MLGLYSEQTFAHIRNRWTVLRCSELHRIRSRHVQVINKVCLIEFGLYVIDRISNSVSVSTRDVIESCDAPSSNSLEVEADKMDALLQSLTFISEFLVESYPVDTYSFPYCACS